MSMKAESFRYDFTAKELANFLFKKKSCPNCGGIMKKEKCFEVVDGSAFNGRSVCHYVRGRQVKHYFYRFTCNKCGSSFTLSALAK